MSFQLWPAIDLLEGKPVRLLQGDYEKKTEYSCSLSEIAKIFSSFSHGIHVVDLDGAKAGIPINRDAVQEIIRSTTRPVEIGGGIRSFSDIELLLSLGASRIILGTSALENPTFLREVLFQFSSEKIVVGVDLKNGTPATHGWQQMSRIILNDFLQVLSDLCVQNIIVTDIVTDGMLSGPPIPLFQKIQRDFPKFSVIASGGVSCIKDLEDLRSAHLSGAVFGKAFYEQKISQEQLETFSHLFKE